ncbi:MAG TPA: hypothetical protein RMG48_01750 [Myxococcales bacterium LLY-WYZ-16_1]|jgi:hypothetical protein|nr:hypothetical protein [Myxococcales bacterium LLY-WYZ-16_1]
MRRLAPGWVLLAGAVTACGPEDLGDVQFLLPPGDLPPGMVFASRAVPGAAGYDLFWVSLDGRQGPVRLTSGGGDDWMPAASDRGFGLVFARAEDGIFYVAPDGDVRRISDTRGDDKVDSFPALSSDGEWVAWVREHLDRPLPSGFFESTIMLATTDGGAVRELNRQEGLVQLAPAFSPEPGSSELIWAEVQFDAQAFPEFYNLRRFDHELLQGELVCPRDEEFVSGEVRVRCWGFHLTWPDDLILSQQQVRFPLRGGTAIDQKEAIRTTVDDSTVIPVRDRPNDAFFQPWPLSASVSNRFTDRTSIMVFDGLATFTDGRDPSLVFFRATGEGRDARRIPIDGLTRDLDPENTSNYLFSVATPSLLVN